MRGVTFFVIFVTLFAFGSLAPKKYLIETEDKNDKGHIRKVLLMLTLFYYYHYYEPSVEESRRGMTMGMTTLVMLKSCD